MLLLVFAFALLFLTAVGVGGLPWLNIAWLGMALWVLAIFLSAISGVGIRVGR
ncbi:hypothetical protein DFAR_3060029 [Desulfarculales bacterium]